MQNPLRDGQVGEIVQQRGEDLQATCLIPNNLLKFFLSWIVSSFLVLRVIPENPHHYQRTTVLKTIFSYTFVIDNLVSVSAQHLIAIPSGLFCR
jgi:hypothetical protein